MSTAVVESPYRGLRPFEDSDVDALLFFGREYETEVVAANLQAARLTVLYGPSGVGKSSVLRAGVMHRLRGDGDAVVRFESWSGEPVEGIADAVRAEVSARLGVEVDDPGGTLAERLGTWSGLLGTELYLVLDQVEEYFLYHGRNGRPDALLSELPDVVNEPGLRVNVLLGIREDSLALLDAFKSRIPQVLGNYLRLDRLDRGSGEAAILGPLAAWHELAGEEVAAEPALVETLLDEVSVEGGRIEAPYLQVVLERIWEAERAAGSSLLRRSTLARLGGAEQIVDEHLERALAGLAAPERDTAAAMFAHLVTPGGTKIAHELHDLASYAGTDVRGVASALVRERILRPVDGGSNGGRVEIYHDVLAAAVADWRRRHETERQLARERRRHRKLAATIGVLVLGLALMTGLAAYAFSQRTEAREQAMLAAAQSAEAERQASVARAQRGLATDQARIAAARKEDADRLAGVARTKQRQAQRLARVAANEREAAEQQRAFAEEQHAVADEQAELAAQSAQRAEREAARAEGEATKAELAERRAEAEADTARRQEGRAEREERIANVRALAARAQAMLAVDPSESLAHAVNASRLDRGLGVEGGSLVEDALRNALLAVRVRAVLGGGGGALRSAAFSSDNRLVVTAAEGGEARIFDARSGRLLQQLRHADAVVAVAAFSPDRRVVITGARDNRARIWSVASGALLRALPHDGPVVDAAFTPDGRLIATASVDRSLRIWDAASGVLLRQLRHPGGLRRVLVSPDGRHALTLTGDRFARVFDLEQGTQVAELAQQGEITSAAFSLAGGRVATTGRRNAVVWDVSTWTPRRTLEGHTFVIAGAAFSPDGHRLVTASADGSARVWNVESGATVMTLFHQHSVTGAAYHPDGHVLATTGRDRVIRIWAGPDANLAFTLAGHDEAVTGVEFSRDGSRVLTRSDDETARIWETWTEPSLAEIARHSEAVTSAVVSPDGRLVLSAGLDGAARLTPRRSGAARILAHPGRLLTAGFGDRGRVVFTAAEDGTARLWRTADGVLLRVIEHGGPIRAAAIDAPAATLASAGSDGSLRLWDARAGQQRWARLLRVPLTAVEFSADGTLLAVGDDDGVVRVLRASDGRLLNTLRAHEGAITALAFSRFADRLATAAEDADGRLWNLVDGTADLLRGHRNGLTAISFSPDGKLLLTTSVDGDARLWDAQSGLFERTLSGHVATVSKASFSADGRWVVTAGPGAAGLWHVRTGQRIFFLRGHDGALRAASFAPDGRSLVTGGVDGTVRTFQCRYCGDVPDLRRRAEARLRALQSASVTDTRG